LAVNLSTLLPATAFALGLSCLSANAATVYNASQSLTLTVVQGDDDVAITYDPDDPVLSVLATGDFPTFATTAVLGTASDTSLSLGDSFELATGVGGIAGNSAQPNLSEASALRTGTLTLENTSQVAAQIVFDILFDMSWFATLQDPLTETASAGVLIEILLGETSVFSQQYQAISIGGTAGATDANDPETLQLIVELDAFESKAYTLRASSFGRATTEPSVVPLPAAAWLLLAGLGGLVLVGRRRAA
jgi:hypothetical protein